MLGKRSPNLRLVTPEGQDGVGGGDGGQPFDSLQIVALSQLSESDQGRVRRIITQVSPGAAILGVALSQRSWDLRPVILVSGEGAPSIIRFLGPEVTLSLGISARMQDLLERLTRHHELSCGIYDWGVLEGQLWFRRERVEQTLADRLLGNEQYGPSEILSHLKSIVAELERWHALGMVHGHLTPSNISISPRGQVLLLDAGVGLAVVQASQWLRVEEFPAGYQRESFGAEALASESAVFSSDIYGLGQLAKTLFISLGDQYKRVAADQGASASSSSVLGVLMPLVERMISVNPKQRPSLVEVREALESSLPTFRVNVKPGVGGASVNVGAASNSTSTSSPGPKNRVRVSTGNEPIAPGHRVSVTGRVPVAGHPAVTGRRSTQALATGPGGLGVEISNVSEATPKAAPIGAGRVNPGGAISQVAVEGVSRALPSGGAAAAAMIGQDDFIRASSGDRQRVRERKLGSVVEEQTKESRTPTSLNIELQPHFESVSDAHDVRSEPSRSSYLLLLGLLGLVFFGVGYLFVPWRELGRREGGYSNEELRMQWSSGRPSQMRIVAETALKSGPGAQFAENLIVQEARKGETLTGEVNIGLLRVAFDSQWEQDLSVSDRKAALAIALSGLLDRTGKHSLPVLDSLHPGVLLAITASSGESSAKFLQEVPASLLAKLPPPYGPAFKVIAVDEPSLTCGDMAARAMAQFATRELKDHELLSVFLAEKPGARLQALALLFASDQLQAQKVLDMVLNLPGKYTEYEAVQWGKKAGLFSWSELDAADRLAVLAGFAPRERALTGEHLLYLVGHPLPRMRGFALEQVLERGTFQHPAAKAVLTDLQSAPETFSPVQTLELYRYFAKPNDLNPDEVVAWLGKVKPTVELLEKLLVNGAGSNQSTPLDFAVSKYLRSGSWKPGVDTLNRLLHHPDDATRLFIYGRVFDLTDVELRRAMLKAAVAKETNPAYRTNLQDMLSQVQPTTVK